MGQKRRRIALSCVDCRRRKVKCDRNYPQCLRCQKGGYGDKCVYVRHTGPGNHDDNDNPTPDDESRHRSGSDDSWADDAAKYEDTARASEARARQNVVNLSPAPDLPHKPTETATLDAKVNQDRKITQLYGRLMQLETMVYAAGGKPTSAEMNLGLLNPLGPKVNRDPNYYSDKYTLADHEKVLLRGKSFKTQYFGPSNSLAILLQFEDLSKFVREILMAIPSLANHKIAMAKIREKEKMAAKAQYDISVEALIGMVPERSFADRLVNQYLDTIETTFRIVHVPTFLKDYEAFWASPQDARPEFVVQLLVSMSTMCCIVSGGEGYVGRSSSRREMATHWINVGSYWLDSQSQKHVSLVNYQLRLQLWIAKVINCIKVKRFWTDSGHIVRRFMAAGLHREPSLLCGKINTFDCEMRRRLWHTALELDLQATLDRGMTPTIGPMDWDTNPPRNIDDESFDMDTESLPEAKPRGEFTRTSYLAWASESLPMRIELLYKINSIRNTLDHDTINAYDDKLRIWIDEIPLDKWIDAVTTSPVSTTTSPNVQHLPTPASLPSLAAPTPTPLITMTLSQALTREYLTVLHQPFATDVTCKSRHFHSRVARRYACLYTVLLYNPQLSVSGATTATAGPPILDSRFHLSETQRRFFACFREDYLRAALSLAHDFSVSTALSSNPFRLHVQDDNRMIHIIEAAVNMLGDRVLSLGQGFHCYWITSSALSYVHSKQSPEVPRKTFTHAAADRVIVMHSIVMDQQLPSAKRLMVPAGDGNDPPDREMSPSSVGVAQQGSLQQRTEEITTVDGYLGLRKKMAAANPNSATDVGGPSVPGTASINPYFVAGMSDMSGGMMGFDQDPAAGVSGDPMQDMMFGLENMDWSVLMSTDPTDFMVGGWSYPS